MPRSSAEAYLGATVLIVLASLVRWGLDFIGQPLLPFTTFYPAILFATYIGGLRRRLLRGGSWRPDRLVGFPTASFFILRVQAER